MRHISGCWKGTAAQFSLENPKWISKESCFQKFIDLSTFLRVNIPSSGAHSIPEVVMEQGQCSEPAEGGGCPLLHIGGAVGIHLQGIHDLAAVQQQLHQEIFPLCPHRWPLQGLHQLQLQ